MFQVNYYYWYNDYLNLNKRMDTFRISKWGKSSIENFYADSSQ